MIKPATMPISFQTTPIAVLSLYFDGFVVTLWCWENLSTGRQTVYKLLTKQTKPSLCYSPYSSCPQHHILPNTHTHAQSHNVKTIRATLSLPVNIICLPTTWRYVIREVTNIWKRKMNVEQGGHWHIYPSISNLAYIFITQLQYSRAPFR